MHLQDRFTQKRPRFNKRQVRTPNGIKPGLILRHHFLPDNDIRQLLVLSYPYPLGQDGAPALVNALCFDYAIKIRGRWSIHTKRFLAGFSVVVFVNGDWESSQYLSHSGRRHLSPDQITAFLNRHGLQYP